MAGITEALQISWTAILTAHIVEEAPWAPCKEVRSLHNLQLQLLKFQICIGSDIGHGKERF